jgi:hypothetical protein
MEIVMIKTVRDAAIRLETAPNMVPAVDRLEKSVRVQRSDTPLIEAIDPAMFMKSVHLMRRS